MWDAESGWLAFSYRVERIVDTANVLLATGHGAEGPAARYPIGQPHLIGQVGSFGATASWDLTFVEIGVVEGPRRGDTCEVRYAPDSGPPSNDDRADRH